MSRLVAVTVCSLFLFVGTAGLAAAQEPPPLEPPSLEPTKAGASQAIGPDSRTKPVDPGPAGTKPVDPKPAAPARSNPVRTAAPKPEFRPMLAIPGVTAPASRPSRSEERRVGKEW